MGTTTASVDVNRPIDMVYHQWTQFESFPGFVEGVERIDQPMTPICTGSRSVPPPANSTPSSPTASEERVACKSDSGPDHAGVVTSHRLDDESTRVTTQVDIDPAGFLENVADKLGILKARVSGDLQRFKDFSENIPTETGAWRGDVRAPTPKRLERSAGRGGVARKGDPAGRPTGKKIGEPDDGRVHRQWTVRWRDATENAFPRQAGTTKSRHSQPGRVSPPMGARTSPL